MPKLNFLTFYQLKERVQPETGIIQLKFFVTGTVMMVWAFMTMGHSLMAITPAREGWDPPV